MLLSKFLKSLIAALFDFDVIAADKEIMKKRLKISFLTIGACLLIGR